MLSCLLVLFFSCWWYLVISGISCWLRLMYSVSSISIRVYRFRMICSSCVLRFFIFVILVICFRVGLCYIVFVSILFWFGIWWCGWWMFWDWWCYLIFCWVVGLLFFGWLVLSRSWFGRYVFCGGFCGKFCSRWFL